MDETQSFGQWLRHRRQELDLTQDTLARLVACAAITIRKMEADRLRPSKSLAESLIKQLGIAPEERGHYVRFARRESLANPDTIVAPRNNLPRPVNNFIGREREVVEVRRLMNTCRLATLAGPGGCGKTRLALQVATELLGEFADGVFFVDLAPISNPALVALTIAQALGATLLGSQPPWERLKDHLREKHLLLLLDNFEQILDAAPRLAELLSACAALKILVTSRVVLHLSGEQEFPVPALAVPDLQALPVLEAMTQYAGVALFIQRARAAQPDFLMTEMTAPAVAEICVRLDGLPLAIELAAARTKVLQPRALLTRLSRRLDLLTGGARDRPARQQTLRNTIDWSYRLLAATEQVLFARLGVFVGGWTLDAASRVCSAAADLAFEMLDGMQALVDHSLVCQAVGKADVPRFTMLETIREYALERLEASGEAEAVRRQHAAYCLAVAEAGTSQSIPPARRDALQTDIDNLRAALTWAQSAVGDAELGLRLALATSRLSFTRGYWSEWRRWAEGALAHADAEAVALNPARAYLLGQLGFSLVVLGEYGAAQAHMDQCLKLFQELGDRPGRAYALNHLGFLALQRGDGAAAQRQLEAGLALYRELGDKPGVGWALTWLGEVAVMQEDAAWATSLLDECLALNRAQEDPQDFAWVLHHLGHVAQIQGDYEQATVLHEESLAQMRQFGTRSAGVADVLHGLAETALAQGDVTLALTHFTAALDQFHETEDKAGVMWCLAGLAGVAVVDAQPERAAWLWGAAEALRLSIGARQPPATRATRERLMAAAREQLGDAAFVAAWAKGQAMTLEQAVEVTLDNG